MSGDAWGQIRDLRRLKGQNIVAAIDCVSTTLVLLDLVNRVVFPTHNAFFLATGSFIAPDVSNNFFLGAKS